MKDRAPSIGIVTTWFERGAGYVSRAFAEALASKFDVWIYARGGEKLAIGDPNWDLPNVTWGSESHDHRGMRCNVDRAHFHRWISERRLDCILFNEEHDWQIVLDARAAGVAIGSYIDYYTTESVPFFAWFDFLICNTRRHYSVFQWHPSCHLVPWGTDCGLFRPRPPASTGAPLRFFHSAGMAGVNLRKGTDLAVRAYTQVRGDAELIIHSQVGLGAYGAVAAAIQEDPRIVFIEATVPAPGLYDRGDVYVYPGRLDGIGLSLAEALASGLPAIVTDSGPYDEWIRDGYNGFRVPVASRRQRPDGYFWPECECDEAALAGRMQWFVDHRELVPQLQSNAREFAVRELDWQRNSLELAAPFERWSTRSRLLRCPTLGRRVAQRAWESRWRTVWERVQRRLRTIGRARSAEAPPAGCDCAAAGDDRMCFPPVPRVADQVSTAPSPPAAVDPAREVASFR